MSYQQQSDRQHEITKLYNTILQFFHVLTLHDWFLKHLKLFTWAPIFPIPNTCPIESARNVSETACINLSTQQLKRRSVVSITVKVSSHLLHKSVYSTDKKAICQQSILPLEIHHGSKKVVCCCPVACCFVCHHRGSTKLTLPLFSIVIFQLTNNLHRRQE